MNNRILKILPLTKFDKIREFFVLFYNVYKEKMLINEIEHGGEAP